MTLTLPGIETLSLSVNEKIRVRASLDATFAALLDQLGPYSEMPDGTPMRMKLEPWPGGRWFRDLGEDNGHFWGVVQAIKKPTLLEIVGPLFMSYPVSNNVQYRLTEENGVTLIQFRHSGFGLITDERRAGVGKGWNYILESARKRAEASRSKSAAIQ